MPLCRGLVCLISGEFVLKVLLSTDVCPGSIPEQMAQQEKTEIPRKDHHTPFVDFLVLVRLMITGSEFYQFFGCGIILRVSYLLFMWGFGEYCEGLRDIQVNNNTSARKQCFFGIWIYSSMSPAFSLP